jgi:hypothetical protein
MNLMKSTEIANPLSQESHTSKDFQDRFMVSVQNQGLLIVTALELFLCLNKMSSFQPGYISYLQFISGFKLSLFFVILEYTQL